MTHVKLALFSLFIATQSMLAMNGYKAAPEHQSMNMATNSTPELKKSEMAASCCCCLFLAGPVLLADSKMYKKISKLGKKLSIAAHKTTANLGASNSYRPIAEKKEQ